MVSKYYSMKQLIFTFLLLPIIGFGQKALDAGVVAGFDKPLVELTFEDAAIDLGQVKRGEKRTFDFVFTNTGREAVEIEIVSACECSTLDWTIKPVKPGEQGKVNVIFDSTEKEESEVIDVDLTLKNVDPETGYQIFKIVTFKYELI